MGKKKSSVKAAPKIRYIERTSFNDLCNDYVESGYHFPHNMRDSLAALLAVVISTELDGDPLWLRIIGPPGSGKSTLAEAASICREHIFPISLQTGFHSGYVEPGGDKEDDNALIPQMNGKTTIIKDGDTLLSQAGVAKILSELRDMYDGTSRARYRNAVVREYEDLKITVIICGTDDLRKLNRSSLGDRFLDCEVLGKSDHSPFVEKASSNTYDRVVASLLKKRQEEAGLEPPEGSHKTASIHIKKCTAGYITYLKSNLTKFPIPQLTSGVLKTINDLASFLAHCRARVARDEDMAHKPRIELPTRLASQLTKFSVCIPIVLNKDTIDDQTVRILRKLTIDTAYSAEFEIIRLMYETVATNRVGYTAGQLAKTLRVSDTFMAKKLDSMRIFNILQKGEIGNHSGVGGRNSHIWRLQKSFLPLCETVFA